MKAIKANRQYTITEADVQSFVRDGYDVYDDNGDVVAYGAGKTVSFEKYLSDVKALESEIEELKKEIAKAKRTTQKKTEK